MNKYTPKGKQPKPKGTKMLPHDLGRRGAEFLPGPYKSRKTGKGSWTEKLTLPK